MEWYLFNTISKEAIQAQISKDLKGRAYSEIIWNHPSGIQIEPYLNEENNIKPIVLNLPQEEWAIIQKINLHHVPTAQVESLKALQNGVNALYYDFAEASGEIDFNALFEGVLLEHIQVHLRNIQPADQAKLEAYIAGMGISGNINLGSSDCMESNPNHFRSKGIRIAEGLDLSAIAAQYQSMIQDLNVNSAHANLYYFEVELGNEFFVEVAKLRAIRLLWDGIMSKFNLNTKATVLAYTSAANIKLEDGHTNILRATTEAMSAVIGNCDGLLVRPHDLDDQNTMSVRIAKNIQLLLKEESGFSFLHDPGNGAYYIDQLTHEIAENIWSIIQSLSNE